MGSVPAAALSSQVEAAMADTELQALKLQQTAEAESARIRKEIADAKRALIDAMRDHQIEATGGR
jgi:multidrug resistance efflux pump